ncbi:hypothetical protein [Calothrix sp. NIES-3974]|uniref:hypothetical protein n=1 Tax=Calothrix sp. NIES-3974 TaxID=2005462 RepID=UPI0012FDFC60|nr:hypothetical protein [Calothrix sp. NIES-3974]
MGRLQGNREWKNIFIMKLWLMLFFEEGDADVMAISGAVFLNLEMNYYLYFVLKPKLS